MIFKILRNVLLNTQQSTPNVAGQKDSVDRKIFQFNLQLVRQFFWGIAGELNTLNK